MPRAGFEPPISDFEQSKTVRALDGATIGNGYLKTKQVKSMAIHLILRYVIRFLATFIAYLCV
jgi:hypothetical protein